MADSQIFGSRSKSCLWLIGWGAVLLERHLTGDSSALPRSYPLLDAEAVSGGRRGAPSTLPGVQEVFLAVESALRPEEVLLRLALEAKYVHGGVQKVVKYVYALPGDEVVELQADSESGDPVGPEPIRYLSRSAVTEELFDIKVGFRAVKGLIPEPVLAFLDCSAKRLGCPPIRLLSEAAIRFERHTLPLRAGWK